MTQLSGRTTAWRQRRKRSGSWRAEQEGILAFWCGVPSTCNPAMRACDRKLWSRGWHRARMAKQRGMRWGSAV
jgi:hypothetical protein